MRVSNKFVLSAILGVVVFVVLDVLTSMVYSIINPTVAALIGIVNVVIVLVLAFVSIFATILVYYKAIIKKDVVVAKLLFGSVVTALIRSVLSLVQIPYFLKVIIGFVVIYLGVLVTVILIENSSVKKEKKVPSFVNVADIEDIETLRENILNALKPQLKAPLTAVLCEKELLSISESNGIYNITGNVNSQNSYGAMISTDFTAQAQRVGDSWVITKTVLGVKMRSIMQRALRLITY